MARSDQTNLVNRTIFTPKVWHAAMAGAAPRGRPEGGRDRGSGCSGPGRRRSNRRAGRLYTGFGTLSGDLGKVAEAVTSFAFGRVHLYLLPGMWVARPGRRTGAPHPGTPTCPVNGRASVPVPGEELQPDRGQNSLLTRHDVRKVHVRELQADFLAADSRPDRGPGVDRLAVTRLQLEDKGHQFRLRLVDPEVKAPVRRPPVTGTGSRAPLPHEVPG